MQGYHKSVLVKEVLNLLQPKSENALFIDGTMGEGGHSLVFLNAFPKLKVIGLDADSEIQAVAKMRLSSFDNRVSYCNTWSDEFFESYPSSLPKPDLILFDLGISMYHYTKSKKGFSFSVDDDIDMRLSPSLSLNAYDIVNSFSADELKNILKDYGEERFASQIANSIVKKRQMKKIESARELADIVYHAVPAKFRHLPIHPATKTFQSLRIKVNKELERLPRLLRLSFAVLKVGGRLGVITFHSLEDRIVKLYFRELGKTCTCPPSFPVCKCGGHARATVLTKKAIAPTEQEIRENSAARSAKLRVVEKLDERDTL